MNTTNLQTRYLEVVVPQMKKRYALSNSMEVPRLVKCVVNMGVGKATEDIKLLEDAAADLTLITGRKPIYTRSKKSISNFKVRKGQAIGCTVTLRRRAMYEFLDRLMNVVLPRIRDFRGVNARSFDAQGNFTFGLKEQTIFPEVSSDRVNRPQGMNITVVTTAANKEQSLALLILLGMPFRDKDRMLTLEQKTNG